MWGLAVFVKNYLQKSVQVIPNKNEDSIWIKLNQNRYNEEDDIYIGTLFMSPINKRNKNKDDLFTILNDEISRFKGKGNIFVQGDLNARIGQNDDFLTNDKFDKILGLENNYNLPTRNAEDSSVNARGKELLDFCKTNDYQIVNGRKLF